MKKQYILLITIVTLSGAILLFSNNISAQEIPDLSVELYMPGQIKGAGTFFSITDSQYLNITLDSVEPIKLKMESIPEMITMMIEPVSSASSTQIILSGFQPNTTYYLYQDDYHNLTEFITDDSGTYSYTQYLLTTHFVFIQPRKSTKFIKDDATGGDCYLIGNWDITTKTCILIGDVYETIQIDNSNITLDGNSYSLIGNRTGNGVYVYAKNNIIIKNLTVKNFNTGIYLQLSNNSKVTNNTVDYNQGFGIFLSVSDNNVLINNSANFMRYYSGLAFSSSNNNTIQENTTSNNNRYGYGININSGNNNIIANNIANSNYYSGINISYGRNNAVIDNRVESSYYYAGIRLYNTNDNAIKNNNVNYNSDGIWVHSSSYNNIITNNNITYNRYAGINIRWSSYNKVYNNNFIGNPVQSYNTNAYNNDFALPSPIGGNYWNNYDEPSEGCNDLNNDKICDLPYIFTGGQDNLPWKVQNGWSLPQNQPPAISNLNQYKADGITTISESGIITEGAVVFKAILSDQDNDQVKLQIELKEFNQSFNKQDLVESGFINSGDEAVVSRQSLVDGQYKWRARAIDSQGNAGDWQEFGTPSNIDFDVKLVPLYTQVISSYPSLQLTGSWDDVDYAQGLNYSCGSKIYQCGCALTSGVMVLRYYDDDDIMNGQDINPQTLNSWLNSQLKGYSSGGSVNWLDIARYSGNLVKYDIKKSGDYFNNYAILDEYLNKNQPAIAKEKSGRGGIGREHFIVIDNKLATTYGVKDPAWYNTQKLNETTNSTNKIRGYENGFDGLRLFYPSDGLAVSALSLNLASPAEFLITDPLGRRFGKDPITNIEYHEIPDASYFTESIDDASGELASSEHENKSVYIENPLDGQYDVKVIGTGSGSYTADLAVYDAQGQAHSQTFTGNTDTNISASYNINYSAQQPQDIVITPSDTVAPVISHTSLNSEYILNSSPITFEFSAQDSGTGVFNLFATLDGQPLLNGAIINFNQDGEHSIIIEAEDFVGNKRTETITYKVIYDFSGFLSPIKADGAGIYKLGRTLPIKFRLRDAGEVFISNAVVQLFVAKISDGIVGTDEIPLSTSNADTGNIFRYDLENEQYIYNLSTNTLSLGSWQLKVILDDGKYYAVVISLR